jgi:hypothetical protein
MRSLLAAITLIAASATVASAEPYVGLGIGTAASGHVGADSSSQMSNGNRSGQLLGGYSFGRVGPGLLAVEAVGTRFSQNYRNTANDANSLGAAGKYSMPLGNGFEGFGRAGLARTWLSNDATSLTGDGWFVGAGFEYRFKVATQTAASLFVDYQYNKTSYDLGSHTPALDATAGMWMLGATVAL